MATTQAGTALTERYRQEQVQIRNGFLAEFFSTWTLLDPFNLNRTRSAWLRAVLRIIEIYRKSSAEAAREYVRDFRQIEGGPDLEPLPEVIFLDTEQAERAARRAARKANPHVRRSTVLPREQTGFTFNPDRQQGLVIDWGERRGAIQAGLEITGPINIKNRTRQGMTAAQIEQAARAALVEASGTASRYAMEGGRETALRLVESDSAVRGYVRVLGPNPCYFCAMLASRGPVYKKGSFTNARSVRHATDPRTPFVGPGEFKVHDHCMCQMEPVYLTDTDWPGLGKDLQKLWNAEIQRKYSGQDAIRQWRKVYDAWAKQRGLDIGITEAA